MTALFCLTLLISQAPPDVRFVKAGDAVEVVAQLPAALQAKVPVGKLTQDQGEDWLRVSLVDAKSGKAGPAMFGAYQRRGTTLVFRPRASLEPGLRYRASFGGIKQSVTTDYRVPSRTGGRPPHIVKVLPSGDVLPANQLRFYIYFSQPMRGGQAMFDQLAILDENGKEVYDPWLHDEIWDEKTGCLILYIHPGRIKWGVALRELLGPVLLPKRRYRLVIRGAMVDAEGQPLAKDFVKEFRTTGERRARIEVRDWKIQPPTVNTLEPVRLELTTAIDHRGLERLITVQDAAGKRVAGKVEIGKNETAWAFRPTQAWTNQEYRITVDPGLEDVAGNTPRRPFDMDLDRPQPTTPPCLERTFRPTESGKR